MTITEFIAAFGQELPLSLAMPDDPVGTQVLAAERELTTVAVAYEVDELTVRRAAESGAELIVAFHPLIYPSLKSITGRNRVERTVVELIDRRIALHIVHTAFDAHPEGTSVLLARRLGLERIRPMIPDPKHEGAGMGAVGEFARALDLDDLAIRLRDVCGAAGVRISVPPGDSGGRSVRVVAIVGGSGMSFYGDAVNAGADAFITADVRYHGFHAANDRIPVLDPGHAESEAFVAEGLARLLRRTTDRLETRISIITMAGAANPVRLIV